MNDTKSTSKKAMEFDDSSVIDLPKQYRGQKLNASSITLHPECARQPDIYGPLLTFLLKQFAMEVSVAKTNWAKRYLAGLNTSEGYVWFHKDFPNVFLVSLAQSEDGSVDRQLLIAPYKEVMRESFAPQKPIADAVPVSKPDAILSTAESVPIGSALY